MNRPVCARVRVRWLALAAVLLGCGAPVARADFTDGTGGNPNFIVVSPAASFSGVAPGTGETVAVRASFQPVLPDPTTISGGGSVDPANQGTGNPPAGQPTTPPNLFWGFRLPDMTDPTHPVITSPTLPGVTTYTIHFEVNTGAAGVTFAPLADHPDDNGH